MGCVGRYIILVVFGIFVVMFERVRARLHYYGGNRLTQRSHLTYISSLGSRNSEDSLAGSALLHMFQRSRPRTWAGCAAKSKPTKRNVLCPAAALGLLPSPVPALQSSWHDVTLRDSSITRRNLAHIPYTPQGNPLSTPQPLPLAHKT